MDNRGLPASGLESVEQAGPFPLPPLMIPRGGGAEGGIRRCCCCWSCCPPRCPCPCLFPPPSPFPQLTVACCNQMDGLAVILQVLNSRFFYFRHRATRITKNLHLILLRKCENFLSNTSLTRLDKFKILGDCKAQFNVKRSSSSSSLYIK